MTPDLASICSDLNIRVVPNQQSRTRAPGETCAEHAMERLLNKHGRGHLTIVLKSIVETEGNGLQLVAPMIYAVSDIVLAYPEWTATTAWLDALDQADLAGIWAKAKANRKAAKPRPAVATMLFQHLHDTFCEPHRGHAHEPG
jgi:hypothetical protein